jgi:hypothetical protein
MKALNKQERNSAILRFSLWLLISVLIICVPVIFTGFLNGEQQNVSTGEKEILIKDAAFERDYISTKIQEIIDLMDKKDSEQLDADIYNAQLMNIFEDITRHSEADTSWRGDMYSNIVEISKYLIVANKIVSSSGANKEKQVGDLNVILLELESCSDEIRSLNDEKKKKDMSKGLTQVDSHLKKAVKMLSNYQEGLK